jgi:hypothetical protein
MVWWHHNWLTRAVPAVKTHPSQVQPDTDLTPETGEPIVAHIVKTEPGENAAAKVLEARINGTPIEALCGHVWVPSRDPKQVPMCQKCKDIYDTYRMFNEGLGDTPSE